MSYNSPVFDYVAYYEGKTTKELLAMKKYYLEGLKRFANMTTTEHKVPTPGIIKALDLINKTLADRIGRKK